MVETEHCQTAGWRELNLLSSHPNTFDRDPFGDSVRLTKLLRKQHECKPDEEWGILMLNIFRRDGNTIRHFWGSELLYVPTRVWAALSSQRFTRPALEHVRFDARGAR